MLPRQREFCRFYLQGMTASAAAIAAGYAKSTAERNAASILQNPAVMAKLERMRQVREAPFHVAGQAALEGFTFSVMTEKDVRLKAAASRPSVGLDVGYETTRPIGARGRDDRCPAPARNSNKCGYRH